MSLGQCIRSKRKSLNLTLQQLAFKTDADAGNLSRIERGELGVSESLLRKIAVALETTPANLYAESDATFAQNETNKNQVNEHAPSHLAKQVESVNSTSAKDFVQWFRSATALRRFCQ